MNTKRILVSVVTGALLTGSLLAASGNDQVRSKTKVKATKPAATTTVRTGGNARMQTARTRDFTATRTNRVVRTVNDAPRTRYVTRTTGNPRVVGTTGTPVRTRVVTRNGSYYPYSSTGYGYSSYGYGYPSYGYSGYSYGPSISFGFGSPYYGGYYPYDYGYGYGYPSGYNYGYYYYNQPRYAYGNGSVVIAVQTRLARAGYYHGPIDGVMGARTSYAIRAYEHDHGLPVDGMISGPLMRNMGLRY